jgi:hypothetical protein
VAATGLLGFNPYGKAQALDFSSKPTQLAIQLQQKEQAKSEAYEKYFMDYEKSLNPAGLAEGESREFLNKYNRIKENWIKNKQAILNPARYGYEAQAEYSALLKDAVSYIDLGKQATAERKAYNTTLSQARKAGKNIEGDLEVTANAMKTVGLGYEAPDISRVDIFDPYDDRKFMQNVWGTAELPTRVINKDIGGGKVIPETYYLKIPEMVTQAPERLKDAEIGTRGYVRNNRGAGKYFKILMADERLLAEANKVYKEYKGQGAKINDEEDFAVAYGLIKKPGGFVKAGEEKETAAYIRGQQDALIRGRQNKGGVVKMENLFDKTGGGGIPVKIGNSGYEIVAGKVLDKNGNPATVNFKNFSGENFQPELYSVLEKYGIDLRRKSKYTVVAKDGQILSIKDAKGNVIDRKTVMNAQKKFDTERKGEEPLYDYGEDGAPKVGAGINWE